MKQQIRLAVPVDLLQVAGMLLRQGGDLEEAESVARRLQPTRPPSSLTIESLDGAGNDGED